MNSLEQNAEFEEKMLTHAREREASSTSDAISLLSSFMNETSKKICEAVCPLSSGTAPVVIATLEMYAESFRNDYPDACEMADALKGVVEHKMIKVSMPRRVNLD